MNLMLKIIANRSEKLKDRVNDRWMRFKGRPVMDMFKEMVHEIERF